MKVIGALVGAFAVLASMLALVPPAVAQTTDPSTYQRQIFRTTNQQREKHGLVKYRHQSCVQRYAVRQAKIMARQDRMFHQDLVRVLNDCGLQLAGENVAYGYDSGRSVVNQGWMHSPGHRANILNPAFRLLGSGARRSADGTWYAAQVFGTKL